MHRRDFVAATLALPALRRALPLAGPQFACASITWEPNDLQALDDISALGFRGVQLRASAVRKWGDRPGELRELLAARKLKLVALSSGNVRLEAATHAEDLALHERNARFLREVGGLYLQVIDERPKGRDPVADDFKQMGAFLTEIGKRCADVGVTLGYHNHMGALGQSPEEFARVLDASDARCVRLELDIAHCHAAGGDPVDAIARHRERLLFLHLKDLRTTATGYQFVELGEGVVNVKGVLQALERVGFTGWGVVELDAVPDQTRTPKQSAMISRRYLESLGYHI